MAGRMVNVIAPDGTPMAMPEENVQAAVQTDGFRIDDSAQYEGSGGRAFLEGVGRGASLGLSDVAQTAGAGLGTEIGNWFADVTGKGPTERATGAGLDAGVETIDRSAEADAAMREAKAGLLGRQQAHSGLATAGELVGGIGLGVATGGLGTAPLLAKGSTVLGRAGYTALAGGLEGAAFGAAKAADDDFLADREITAERIMLGFGEGAVLGGLLGGTGSLLGSGASYLTGKASELVGSLRSRLGRPAADETVDSLTAKALMGVDAQAGVRTDDALDASADAVTATSMSTSTDDVLKTTLDATSEAGLSFDLQQVVDPVVEQEARGALVARGLKDDGRSIFQQARAAEGGFERAQQRATLDISSDLKTFVREVDQIDEYAGIAAKRRASELFNMPGMRIGMQEVGPVLGEARERLSYLLSSDVRREAIKSGGGYTVVSRVTDMLDAVERDVAKAFSSGNIGDGYMLLDQGLKKTMQQAAKSKNPLVAEVFKEASDRVRLFLEDESVWGELARRQRAVNPAWTERIRREGDADIGGFFKRSGEAAENPFEVLDKPNGETIGSLLNRLGDAESEGTEEAFRRYLRASVIDAETRAQAWGSADLRKRAATIKAAAERIEKRMDEVALMRRDASAWAEVKKNVESVPFAGSVLRGAVSLTQRAAGFAESQAARTSTMSAAAGAGSAASVRAQRAAEAAASGASMAEVAAARKLAVIDAARQQARRGEETLENASLGFLRSLQSRAKRAADRIAPTVPIAGVVLRPSDPGSYEQTIQHLIRLQDPASEERRRLDERAAELALESPEHAAAVQAQVQRTADFLVRKAGPSALDIAQPFGHLVPPRHDRGKSLALARYARAAQNPEAALKRIAAGTNTREDAETLRELYPRLWARFGTKVRAQLAEAKQPPSYAARLRLSEVLDQPMTPFESPTFQAAISQSNGASAEADAAAKRVSPSNISTTTLANNSFAAGSDQALARGE